MIPKSFEGVADCVAKPMEFAIDCGVHNQDTKVGQEMKQLVLQEKRITLAT